MNLSQLMCASLETALNRYIQLDPDGPSYFAPLEGRILALDITGLNMSFYLFPADDGFMILSDFDGEADARLSGTPLAFAKLGLAKDKRDQLFSGEIEMSGDTRLANQFSRLFSQLDIDWEDMLSQQVGDIAAHKAGNLLRDAGQWLQRAGQSVSQDAGEYLQEESRLSPSIAELRSFMKQVDELREGADRLAAKVKIFKNHRDNNH